MLRRRIKRKAGYPGHARGEALVRAGGVLRVVLGGAAWWSTKRLPCRRTAGGAFLVALELDPTLAVGHGDGEAGAGHSGQQR
jgi:hypothetical protein